jgi:hypothetical protein
MTQNSGPTGSSTRERVSWQAPRARSGRAPGVWFETALALPGPLVGRMRNDEARAPPDETVVFERQPLQHG